MKFGIRKKMFFITLSISIVISFIIGFSIFRQAYRLFLDNFLEDKLSLARSISGSLDGDALLSFTTPEVLSDERYLTYQRYLNKIKHDNNDISYLYAVIYDEDRKHHIYTLDANTNKTHTLWVETDPFALICRIDNSKIEIEYDQKLYTEDFTIEIDDEIVRVSFTQNNIYLNDALLFSILTSRPLTLNTVAGPISELDNFADHSQKGTINLNGEPIPIYLTLSLKGLPESIPGESYNEHDLESIEELNQLLAEDRDYASDEFVETEFGDTLFIYSIVHDSSDRPTGVLGLEVWAREATDYRRSIFLVAGIVSVIAFILSVSIYLLVTENMVIKAIKKFSGGVEEITKGNFDYHINIKRNDEIGDLATTFNGMTDGLKERDMVKDLFGKYVQKEVAEMVLKSEIKLGGEKQVATVLFSDIRSFTTLSEQLEPKNLVSMLNRYFTAMVDHIIRYSGVLDKYIGDALMVHFGILSDTKNSADNAVKTAIDMTKSLMDFNEQQENRKEPQINIGIGIHTGELVAGNIGSPNRMEYTVVGDTVNLASRAEGLTKLFGAHIVITEATHENLKDQGSYLSRPLDLIVVKGKTKPVLMYEIFDADSERTRQKKKETLQELNNAVILYRSRDFKKAKKIFFDLIKFNESDVLVKYYSNLCDYFLDNPPKDDWNGSAIMKTK
ncbi:MAG: adenylate/guanylate cyclase domain-containing protein [Spirochaetota bacterium]|nr:MAG: adenylate/guanylate cyclase domain-containing protein [Spirochaetota bacterium]